MSPPRKNADSAEAMLARIRDLESSFYEVENAAGVVWDLLSGMFDGRPSGDAPELHQGEEHCFRIDPGQVERLHYAVAQSWQKAGKLKEDLLAGLGYGAS